MKLLVNGELKEFPGKEVLVQDVIDSINLNTMFFVVFRNDELVDRLQYLKQKLDDGDDITVFPLLKGA